MKFLIIVLLIIFIIYQFFHTIDLLYFAKSLKTNLVYVIKAIKNDSTFDFLKSLAAFGTLFTSLFNICLVIFFFRSERNYKNKMLDVERQSFWYRKLILEKKIDTVSKVFDTIEVEDFYNIDTQNNIKPDKRRPPIKSKVIEQEPKEKIFVDKIKTGLKSLKRETGELNGLIRIIDPKFANTLDECISFFADEYMKSCYSYFNSQKRLSDHILLINNYKQQYYELIYIYEKNGYKLIKEKKSKFKRFTYWLRHN